MGLRGGIDLGGTKILAVVVGDDHDVLGQSRRPTPTDGGPPRVAEALVEALREAAEAAGADVSGLDGVGIGAPGAVDAKRGTVSHAPNLPDWERPFALAGEVSGAAGTPAYLANDVGVAVDGEAALGAGKPYASFLGIWWGTGIGGHVVLRHRRWQGRGAAGEFGHMVVRLGGRPERGNALTGTVEAYAGRRAMELHARDLQAEGQKTELFKLMEKKGADRLTSSIWQRALDREDEVATKLIGRAIEVLGAGAASVVNLLDLEAIVIGGGLATRLGQPYADRVAAAMRPHLFVPERPPEVCLAALGDYAGAIGATLLVSSRARRRARAA
jgi:glucokinase